MDSITHTYLSINLFTIDVRALNIIKSGYCSMTYQILAMIMNDETMRELIRIG